MQLCFLVIYSVEGLLKTSGTWLDNIASDMAESLGLEQFLYKTNALVVYMQETLQPYAGMYTTATDQFDLYWYGFRGGWGVDWFVEIPFF